MIEGPMIGPIPEAVVIGCSAGGLAALRVVLAGLPARFAPAVVVVAHTAESKVHLLPELLQSVCRLPVGEAEEMQPVRPGVVAVAPPGYHLLIEDDRTFSLSIDPRVCHSRPSIDVLFRSAVDAYGARLAGVLLTGANADGARGLLAIRDAGGVTLVQDPATAESPTMPAAAIDIGAAGEVLPLDRIGPRLAALGVAAEAMSGNGKA